MTEKDTNTPAATDNSPAKASPKSNFAKAAEESGGRRGKKPAKGGRGKGWLWLLLFVILAGGAGTWAWYQWPQLREQLAGPLDFLPFTRSSEDAPGAESEPQPAPETPSRPGRDNNTQPSGAGEEQNSRSPEPTESAEEIAALRSQLERQNRTINQLQQQLARLQRDVTSQGNRLGELGSASRDDWQLAEADYLLRLANQRLLLERDTTAALGLLEEVDKILHAVDLPDLYGVRQQLARDITALKLVENVDREGLYLRLRALEEQLLRVSIQPQFDLTTPAPDTAGGGPTERGPTDTQTPPDTETAGAWQRSWQKFSRFMGDSVRIRDGEIDPVLLSPQSEARFRQSLRLNMEQAELALLREDTTVYKDALNRARELLLQYGAASKQREVLANELEEVREEPIQSQLPNLAASQSALHDYIERLHKMSVPGADASGAAAPGTDEPDADASGPDESDAEAPEPQAPGGDNQ